MLNFALCDDNLNILNKISKMLESIFINNKLDGKVVFTATDAESILTYSNKENIDVYILDIDLKSNISGLDLAGKIRNHNKNAYLIFTTAHLEYIMMAYKFKTFDYLAKPITMERLEETILRLFDDIKCNSKNTYIKIGTSSKMINGNDLYCIKKQGMKLIYCTKEKSYETYSSFSKIENCLPENFVRCHKSYIANINKISNINKKSNVIQFDNFTCCSIGPKYKLNLMEVLNNGNITNNLECINNRK